MNFEYLYTSIKTTFYNIYGDNIPIKFQNVLFNIHDLNQPHLDQEYSYTKIKIILEGVYQGIPTDSQLKIPLSNIRNDIWQHNDGTPPMDFLQSHKKQIHHTKNFITSMYWSKFHTQDLHTVEPATL